MKASPMPAHQNEGERAALDLLVLIHGVEDRSRVVAPAGDVADLRRQADAREMALDTRSASAKSQRPRRAEKRAAQTMPIATPSPWTSRALS